MHRSIPERSGSEPVKEKVGGEAKLKDFGLSEDVDSQKHSTFSNYHAGMTKSPRGSVMGRKKSSWVWPTLCSYIIS